MTASDPQPKQVLVARLSGPLQSWGEHSPYTHRGSVPYPTYSGLLGLMRAALGSSRQSDPASWAWLRALGMVVRIDAPGSIVRDFHTVNPPPADAWASTVGSGRKGSKATGIPFTVPNGEGKLWSAQKPIEGAPRRPSTLVSERIYLSDAAFTLLVDGPAERVAQLAAALTRPEWQLSLGRKACAPDWPLVLGRRSGEVFDLAGEVPIVEPAKARRSSGAFGEPDGAAPLTGTAELHSLNGRPAPASASTVTHSDDPVGSHPHAGHTPRVRHVTQVTAPLTDRPGLRAWASTHLDPP